MKSTLELFTQHLDLSQNQLDDLLSKSLNNCLNSPEVQQELQGLDTNLLKETLPTAGNVLAEKLPPFYNWLKNELGVKRVPDSPLHTTKWVIGFLNNQESLTHLVELHRPVPRQALESSTPRLLAMFDGIKDARVRQQWQKAIAILCLIIIVDARES
ncbi:MAG: hypothetical protein ACHBN1_24285 [Heteroscytonema crispum UTEX LB 1556]